jgi:hypothetical protein
MNDEPAKAEWNVEQRPDLGEIITALHDSEINGSVAWVYDDVWGVMLGDPWNGIAAGATVHSRRAAAEWTPCVIGRW